MSRSVDTVPSDASSSAKETVIVYDGDCPFCSRYIQMLRLRRSLGPVVMVDARQGGAHVAEVERLGLDLDTGMAVRLNGRWSHGADAINVLSMFTSPSNTLNALSAWLFRSQVRARILYPVLRAGRNATLRLLRRKHISETRAPGGDHERPD